jgi:death on curing protein
MNEPRWITSDVARVLHDMQLAAFGGPPGIRDEGLLDSALARPRHRFAYARPVPSLTRLAAAYAFGIVRNHPFVDGNKRTGLLLAFVFLELNGIEVRASEEDAYSVFMQLAEGLLTEPALARWFAKNSTR